MVGAQRHSNGYRSGHGRDRGREERRDAAPLAMTPPKENETPGVKDASQAPEMLATFELWDYSGGALFRGFTAGKHPMDIGGEAENTMFVFFDRNVVGRDLKQGCAIHSTSQFTHRAC